MLIFYSALPNCWMYGRTTFFEVTPTNIEGDLQCEGAGYIRAPRIYSIPSGMAFLMFYR